jgi:hypothetical protein
MEILIEWNGKSYKATVIDDYKVKIPNVKEPECPIELDRCKECGEWKSEDEELYGDGYCTHCATICPECNLYFNYKEMILDGDEYICKSCNAKII